MPPLNNDTESGVRACVKCLKFRAMLTWSMKCLFFLLTATPAEISEVSEVLVLGGQARKQQWLVLTLPSSLSWFSCCSVACTLTPSMLLH